MEEAQGQKDKLQELEVEEEMYEEESKGQKAKWEEEEERE